MIYLIALITMVPQMPAYPVQTGNAPLVFEQLSDGEILFFLPGEGYHDVTVTGPDGKALTVKKLGDNAWTTPAAPSGTFSVILCSPTNCTPLDYAWEIEGYVEPPAGPFFSTAIAVVFGVLMLLIVLGILYQYWQIADERAMARRCAGLRDDCNRRS